ncbi:MAG: carbohydrate porin [Beijerinckiaceae bacterium]
MPKIGDGAGHSRAQGIRSFAIAGASTLALTITLAGHPVLAAELVLPPLPVFASGSPWEGFYGGGNVGYVFLGSSSYATDASGVPSAGQTSVVGEEHIDGAHQLGPLSAGFQAGYNHVTASGLLLGVEADFSFPGILRSNLLQNIAALGPSVINDNVQIYGSLGGRAGYTFGNWLVYGTGGFAYDRDRLNTTDFATGNVDDNVYFWRPGWTAAAGVEVMWTANLSAKLEYRFYDFAHADTYLPVAAEHYNSNLTFHTVMFGLNYHFVDNPVAPGTTGGILPQSVRDDMSIHAQTTIIGQGVAPFAAAYSGPNSLNPNGEVRDTWSVTGFFGYKDPYEGTEFYYNPEPFQGYGLSQTHGLAGFSDIEAQKAGYDFPHYNTARVFIRHVFGLGGEQEDIADGPNQVAAKEDISRLTFTFGKLAIGDIFDNNTYSHDGRVGFMNWALVDAGAFNYSADQQGYTYGTVLDLNQKDWAVRAGYFLVPDVSNGENFDMRIGQRGQSIIEAQHNYSLFGMDGIVRVLAFEEQFYAGSYAATLANPYLNPLTAPADSPGIAATRETRSQYGFVGNAELAVTKDLGLFARLSWWNGQSEIIYTDIDESASVGGVLTGTSWGRPLDKIGLAAAVNGISSSYQAFLAAGGLGVNIGDGALSYAPETIVEAYYSISITKDAFFTFDYQFAANPGYNSARGPASIGSVRLHVQL